VALIGERLSNRYEILGELGRGGMGIVYRARDPALDREVAVKVIAPGTLQDEAEERFRREAQVVAKMDHPGIAPIYDFGRHGDSLFLVMPVVPGASLRTMLQQRSLRVGDVLEIGIAVADALEYSHQGGVIHRDIKPENIMVAREESGALRVRVMDFGLARISTNTRMTQTGVLVGTMAYLSPEQVLAKPAGKQADIYALGSVLYECLVGSPPFVGEVQSILYRIVHEIPEAPRSRGVGVDEALEGVLLGCLRKEPSERPGSAGALAQALRLCRGRLAEADRLKSVVAVAGTSAPRTARAPFVGRGREVETLQHRLNAAIAGECQFVLVGGDPGSGKTRLLEEIEGLARARGVRVLHGRFVEQNRSLPYQGFCEAIQEYFRLKEVGSSSAELPDFSDVAQDLITIFPMLSEINEIRTAASGRSSLTHAGEWQRPENRSQVFELLARALARLAGGRPLLLLLEDLHGAEVSLEALQYIIPRLGPTPTLVVGTYRSTEVDRRHPLARLRDAFEGDRRFASLALGPLSASESTALLQTILGGTEVAEGLAQRVFERAEGNPFFTKELVRALTDSGALERDDTGTWRLDTRVGVRSEDLPETIQQAVEKRIQRLPDDLREVLSVAAVLGKTFEFEDLERLAGETKDLDRAVDRLVEEGLVEEERIARSDRLRFASGMVRDVLYAQIPRRRRRSLHAQCAQQIERRQKERLDRVYPQLVYHYAEADVADKTVEYGLLQARAALEAFSPEEALHATRVALDFLDGEWEGERTAEGEARLLLARASRMAGEMQSAFVEARRAADVFRREARGARVAEALLFAAESAWQARQSDEARRCVEEGLEAARAASEAATSRALLGLGATLANLRGDHGKAADLLRERESLQESGVAAGAGEETPRGGTLVVPMANPVKAREPCEIGFGDEAEVLHCAFETMVTTDDGGNLVPWLCEKWEPTGEGEAFLLTLRGDVRCHDGTVLTAADVKRSFERGMTGAAHKMPAAYQSIVGAAELKGGQASEATGIVVRSERELEVRFTEPQPLFGAFLSDVTTAVAKESGGAVVGTGPFRVVAADAQRITLDRHDGYWRRQPARLDSLEFRFGKSPGAIAEGLLAGEFDVGRDLLADDLERVLKDPRFRGGLLETARNNTYFTLFNCRDGPVARDARVRHALCGVVRIADLVWQTVGHFAQPAVCLIPPGILGHEAGRKQRAIRTEEAAALLRTTGLATPLRLRASVHPLIEGRFSGMLKALFGVWAQLGVEVTIETRSMAAFVETWERGEGIDFMIARWNADFMDPDNFTHGLFHSATGLLRAYFSSPEIDALCAEGRAARRAPAREALYRKVEMLLHEGAVLLPLFHDIDGRVASPLVKGLRLTSRAPYANYAEAAKSSAPLPPPEQRRPRGGVLFVPIPEQVPRTDPALVDSTEEAEVLPSVFEGLTRDVGAGIAPWLATEWRVEDRGRKYRFRLREDVRFHDGRRLTARDVRYSYERCLQMRGASGRGLLNTIRGAEALASGAGSDLAGFRIHSAHEFTIELEEPVSFFPALISDVSTGIVPEGSTGVTGSWRDGCVGTGPFRIVRIDPGRSIELEANPHYWRRGWPRSDGLVFRFGLSPREVLSEFQSGRLAIASDLLPEDVEALRRDPQFAAGYRETPSLSVYAILLGSGRGPLADRALRERLVQAIPIGPLVRGTLGRLAIPAQSLIPPGLLGHDSTMSSRSAPPGAAPRGPQDIELSATIHPAFLARYAAFWKRIEAAMLTAGFRIRRLNSAMKDFIETIQERKADLIVGRWSADIPDPDNFVYAFLHSRGFYGGIAGSPDLDALIRRGREEGDAAARRVVYRQIEDMIARDALVLPLFHDQIYRVARPEIDGLSVSYFPPFVRYENLRAR